MKIFTKFFRRKQSMYASLDLPILEQLKDASLMQLVNLTAKLECSLDGLTRHEVALRKERFGSNVAMTEKPPTWYQQLFYCLVNPFNLVLFFLALVSWATDDIESAILMCAMVTISIAIRFFQEYRSGREAEKLKSLVQTTATVRRMGDNDVSDFSEISMHNLVPGDIIRISAGDMIPADLRLVSARDLFVNQSMLTGEGLPVEKNELSRGEEHGALEQPNLCFMGSNVVSGAGLGLVVGTGGKTYLGSLARSISSPPPETGFERGVNSTSWLLIRFIFVMAPLVFLINGLAKGGWIEAMMFAIAVAVGLTPEMLPMIITANLAKGAINMAKRKVVVKHLSAIHNFGSMDILCTDKTGTLTMDKIILQHHLNIEGQEDACVLQYAYLNSVNQTGLKNLMDLAVLEEAQQHPPHKGFFKEIAKFSKIDEIPFDFMRRRMSVVVENEKGQHILICKGAVEELLDICTHAEVGGKVVKLSSSIANKLHEMTNALNEDGFRVLILAQRNLPKAQQAYTKDDEKGLVLKGLLAFLDPPKESACRAIPALMAHDIQIKIITGDNPVVTRHICTQVGLPAEPILLGAQIEKMSEQELQSMVNETVVFAKVSPLQKAQIIRALKANGHSVGFLGDGVNDAPALHEADVGISVDTGADIAKESADIILLEKSLMVLEEGIIEGRITFINIIKYIKMALSSNFGNVFSIVGASLILPFLPMLPGQLLVQNLLYDMSQTAIPLDRVDKEMMKKPKEWSSWDMTRFMLFFGPISSIFDYITFALLWYYFDASSVATQSLFHTGWFIEGLVTQTLIIHIIRTQKIPFIESTASPWLIAATSIVIIIGLWLPFSLFAGYMKMVPLPPSYFVFLVAVVIGYLGLTSLLKRWYIKRFGVWL